MAIRPLIGKHQKFMAAKDRGGGGYGGSGRKKKPEPPPKPIPEQDRHICGLICVCQLTFVLSSVSLVYLSVAIYLPGYRAFNAAIETVPIMCQTINSTVSNNCEWASCGEWCLTKPSGNCPQYLVTVRQNGTEIGVKNCTRLTSVSCPQVSVRQTLQWVFFLLLLPNCYCSYDRPHPSLSPPSPSP